MDVMWRDALKSFFDRDCGGNPPSIHFEQVFKILDECADEFWGCMGLGAKAILLIGKDISEERRSELAATALSSFDPVYFLSGLDKEIFDKNPTLVQRVIFYGGTLPGWKWAEPTGDWQEFLEDIQLTYAKNCMVQTGVEISAPVKKAVVEAANSYLRKNFSGCYGPLGEPVYGGWF